MNNYVGRPNSQRFPTYFSLNVKLYRDFKLPDFRGTPDNGGNLVGSQGGRLVVGRQDFLKSLWTTAPSPAKSHAYYTAPQKNSAIALC